MKGWVTFVSFVVGLAAVSCGDSEEATPPSSSDSGTQGATVEVIAEDFSYVPETIEVAAGGEMTLINRGYAFHDMKIEGEEGLLIRSRIRGPRQRSG